VRARLDLPPDAFVVVTAGLMTPEKCPGVVMEAFRRFRRQHPQARWLIVGRTLEGFAEWEQEADLGDAVRHLGYVEGLAAFYDALAAADVCLNLRHPTAGETSGAVLRAMAVGLPVVVSNQGWYAELPEDCCLKVKHDGSEADQVLRILEELIGQPEASAEMGRRAREYVAHACDPRHVAQDYVDFLRSVLISIGEDEACTSST
jgi:glycosyltransferase involved in cell wall biosynthesis